MEPGRERYDKTRIEPSGEISADRFICRKVFGEHLFKKAPEASRVSFKRLIRFGDSFFNVPIRMNALFGKLQDRGGPQLAHVSQHRSIARNKGTTEIVSQCNQIQLGRDLRYQGRETGRNPSNRPAYRVVQRPGSNRVSHQTEDAPFSIPHGKSEHAFEKPGRRRFKLFPNMSD